MSTPSKTDQSEQETELIGLYDKDGKLLLTTSYVATMALNLVFESITEEINEETQHEIIEEIKQGHTKQGGLQRIGVAAGEIDGQWVIYCDFDFKNNDPINYCSDEDTINRLEKDGPKNTFAQIKIFYTFDRKEGTFIQNFYKPDENLTEETNQDVIDNEVQLDFEDMIEIKAAFEKNGIEVSDFPMSLEALKSGHYQKNIL